MYNESKLEEILENHFEKEFTEEKVSLLNEFYQSRSVVPLRNFIPPELFDALKEETNQILGDHGVARNFNVEITNNTPRHMITVGQPDIAVKGDIIPSLYKSKALVNLASRLVGEQVFECPYLGERYVISSLQKSGDTHGWHWDDYALGMVWVLEAPEASEGGFVQSVPNTSWDKENPDVFKAILDNPIHSYAFKPGDAYIIRADKTLHRVHPISSNNRRVIVNTTWALAEDFGKKITHETNDILFGGSTKYDKSA
jgi:hypothetical protein